MSYKFLSKLKQINRFLFIGTMSFVFQFCVFSTLVVQGLATVMSVVISYVCAFVFAFFLHRAFTFGNRRKVSLGLFRYFCLQVLCLFLASGALQFLVEIVGVSSFISFWIVIPLVGGFSFYMSKIWVFESDARSK